MSPRFGAGAQFFWMHVQERGGFVERKRSARAGERLSGSRACHIAGCSRLMPGQ
jgi:hypothetical protein